jgi:hypothetical protein
MNRVLVYLQNCVRADKPHTVFFTFFTRFIHEEHLFYQPFLVSFGQTKERKAIKDRFFLFRRLYERSLQKDHCLFFLSGSALDIRQQVFPFL